MQSISKSISLLNARNHLVVASAQPPVFVALPEMFYSHWYKVKGRNEGRGEGREGVREGRKERGKERERKGGNMAAEEP